MAVPGWEGMSTKEYLVVGGQGLGLRVPVTVPERADLSLQGLQLSHKGNKVFKTDSIVFSRQYSTAMLQELRKASLEEYLLGPTSYTANQRPLYRSTEHGFDQSF